MYVQFEPRVGSMASQLMVWLMVLVYHVMPSCNQDLKQQSFKSFRNKAPSTPGNIQPIDALGVNSLLMCATACAQNPCCVSALISPWEGQGHVNTGRVSVTCEMFDVYFDDMFMSTAESVTYIFRVPLQGMYHFYFVLIT